MKNAIIVIGTNRYSILALRLINGIFAHYKGVGQLDVHVFSDRNLFQAFATKKDSRVCVFYHESHHSGWWDSSFSKTDAINHFDYSEYLNIASLDADSKVVQDFVEEDIFLPLFAMEHISGNNNGINAIDCFQELPESSAYIHKEERSRYYQSDYFGGTTENFLKMITDAKLKESIDRNSGICLTYAEEGYLQP